MTYEVIARFEGGFINTWTYENTSIENITELFKEANKKQGTFRAVVLTIKCIESGAVEVIDL